MSLVVAAVRGLSNPATSCIAGLARPAILYIAGLAHLAASSIAGLAHPAMLYIARLAHLAASCIAGLSRLGMSSEPQSLCMFGSHMCAGAHWILAQLNSSVFLGPLSQLENQDVPADPSWIIIFPVHTVQPACPSRQLQTHPPRMPDV
eukprot:366130-Chlamydomonas_euryale.AAC.47